MRITTDHARSSYGCPVILDDAGEPMDDAAGIQAVRHRLGLSTAQVGGLTGRSARTVEGWEQGRHGVPAGALLVLGRLLSRPRKSRKAP